MKRINIIIIVIIIIIIVIYLFGRKKKPASIDESKANGSTKNTLIPTGNDEKPATKGFKVFWSVYATKDNVGIYNKDLEQIAVTKKGQKIGTVASDGDINAKMLKLYNSKGESLYVLRDYLEQKF